MEKTNAAPRTFAPTLTALAPATIDLCWAVILFPTRREKNPLFVRLNVLANSVLESIPGPDSRDAR